MEFKMLSELLALEKSIQGFSYPKSFFTAVKLNLVDLDVWYIMDAKQVALRIEGLRKRYPKRMLIPFARREDNDDVACFEIGKENKVYVIHDYANEGWEHRKELADFWIWFESAIKDMIDFERGEE
jgi:hypothetical protein